MRLNVIISAIENNEVVYDKWFTSIAENVATKRVACNKLNLIIYKTASLFECNIFEAKKLLGLED